VRRLKSFVAVVVALAMLGAVAYVADGWVRSQIEQRIATGAAEEVPQLDVADLQVEVGGRSAIWQLIIGRLEHVRLDAAEVVVDGLAIDDVEVVATGVPTRGGGSVGRVEAVGTVPAATVGAALERRVDLPDGVSIETRDGEVVAVGSVLGVPVEVAVGLVAQPRAIDVELTAFRLGDAEVDPSRLPVDLLEELGAGSISLDELPEGVELTEIDTTPDGVRLVLAGDDLRV
jgi:hypothetical protein